MKIKIHWDNGDKFTIDNPTKDLFNEVKEWLPKKNMLIPQIGLDRKLLSINIDKIRMIEFEE